MTQVNATEVQMTDPSFVFTGAGWSTLNLSPQLSGGSGKQSNAVGNTCQITQTGRACYLNFWKSTDYGSFSESLDGSQYQNIHCHAINTNSATIMYRCLWPLWRFHVNDLRGDTEAHTALLTTLATGQQTVDSVIVLSGAKGTPNPGTIVFVGDSWVWGKGATNQTTLGSMWAARAFPKIASKLGRNCTYVRQGVPNDAFYCTTGAASGDGNLFGMQYRMFSDVIPQQPEFLFIHGGVNDRSNSADDIVTNFYAMCCFIEDSFNLAYTYQDTFDPTKTKVIIGTPGYVLPTVNFLDNPGNGSSNQSHWDNYKAAVVGIRNVMTHFPWIRPAFIFERLYGKDRLLYPNGNADFGLHPNDAGHGVIAEEMVRAAFMGYL